MRVYKVVVKGGWSATISRINGWRPTRYRIGMVSRPYKGNGPLACFRSKRRAKYFARTYSGPVLLCEAVVSRETHMWQVTDAGLMNQFGCLLRGTVLCSSVRPIRRLR